MVNLNKELEKIVSWLSLEATQPGLNDQKIDNFILAS